MSGVSPMARRHEDAATAGIASRMTRRHGAVQSTLDEIRRLPVTRWGLQRSSSRLSLRR